MICYFKTQGLFSGLHFNHSYPSVSHLFFADDSIKFCKATLPQVEAIKQVFQDYASIFGQKVNFQKSAIFFDKNVPLSLKGSITAVLDITKEERNYGTYLWFTMPYNW